MNTFIYDFSKKKYPEPQTKLHTTGKLISKQSLIMKFDRKSDQSNNPTLPGIITIPVLCTKCELTHVLKHCMGRLTVYNHLVGHLHENHRVNPV